MRKKNHRKKYYFNLFAGFCLITAGIFIITYSCFERTNTTDEWYFWGAATAFFICTGLYYLLSASVHKVKSDISRHERKKSLDSTVGEL